MKKQKSCLRWVSTLLVICMLVSCMETYVLAKADPNGDLPISGPTENSAERLDTIASQENRSLSAPVSGERASSENNYQIGQINGKPYYARTSGASTMFYLKSSSGRMARVSAPYVTDAKGNRYYPVNCGGSVLYPELSNGVVTAYCAYQNGLKTTVLSIQAESLPELVNGSQMLHVNGKPYYARTSGFSCLYYLRSSSGRMARVSAPYMTDKNNARFYPINHGGTILIPVQEAQAAVAYTDGKHIILSAETTVLDPAATPRPSAVPTTSTTTTQRPTAVSTATTTATQKPSAVPTVTTTAMPRPTTRPTGTATVTRVPSPSPTAAPTLAPLTEAEIDALHVLNYTNGDAYIKQLLKQSQFYKSYENEYGSKIWEYTSLMDGGIGWYRMVHRVKVYTDGTASIRTMYASEYTEDRLDDKERELNGMNVPASPTPTPNGTQKPTTTQKPSAIPTSTATMTQKPTATPPATVTATATQKPSATPTSTAIMTQEPTARPTATATLDLGNKPLTDAEIEALNVLNYDDDSHIKQYIKDATFWKGAYNEYGSRIVEYYANVFVGYGYESWYYRVKIYKDDTTVIKTYDRLTYEDDELDNKERLLNDIPIPRETGDVKDMGHPTVSTRFLKNDYSTWNSPSRAYLYNRPDGGFTRVEYAIVKADDAFIKDRPEGWIIVEEYSSTFAFQSKILIAQDIDAFPSFGGFYAGEDYNYLILGANNPEEIADKEVARIYKYTKNWKEVSYASVNGNGTREPFTWGSLDCTEHNGYLYIRTGHKLWAHTSPDNHSHQCCWTIVVRESDMTTTWAGELCLASHENNVNVLIDRDGRFVMFDHSDWNPRAGLLQRTGTVGADGRFKTDINGVIRKEQIQLPEWHGNEDQLTGSCTGGLEETSKGYVVAYSWDGKGYTTSDPRNIYVGFVSEDMQSEPVIREIKTQGYASAPMLVSTGLDGGYLLWMDTSDKPDWSDSSKWQFHYARYNEKGEIGTVQTVDAMLSDCQPQYVNGKVVWYATENSGPVFYELDDQGVKKTVAK